MRVVSLIAGITLLVAGIAGLLGRRDQLGAERDRQLATTAELTAAQLDETLARISAVLTVATIGHRRQPARQRAGPPGLRGRRRTARSCSSPPTVAAADIEAALDASIGVPAGPSSSWTAPDGPPATDVVVAIDQGGAPPARQHDARRLRPPRRDDRRPRARRRRAAAAGADGRRTTARTPCRRSSSSTTARGPCARRRPPSVRLTTEERWLVGAQLAVGAVLAAARPRRDARRAPLAAAPGDDRRADRAARTAPSSSDGRPRRSPGSAATAAGRA